jgi:hypothetical protein
MICYAHMSWEAANLVTADGSSFETTVGRWSVLDGCTATAGTATATAFVGAQQLIITASAAATMTVGTTVGTAGFPVAPGLTVNVLVHGKTAVTGRNCRVDIIFYDASGVVLSTTVGTNVIDATDRWRRITNSAVAPDDAAFFSLSYRVASPASSEVHYLDGVIAWVGPALTSEFVYLPGDGATSVLTAPDSAALSPTGDLDVQVHVMMDNWAQTSGSLVAKWITTGNQRSFRLFIDAASKLNLSWSTGGTSGTVITRTSTVALSVASGNQLWVRATLDVDDGAGNHVVTFYASADGVNWTTVGTAVSTAGTTSIFNGTAQLEIGTHDAGTSRMTDVDVFNVNIFKSTTGATQVAGWTFYGSVVAASTVTDSFGNVLTLGGNVALDEWQVGVSDTFEAYLIERNDSELGYQEIARITSPLVTEFDDYEGRRNVTALYRMRVLRTDGSLSLYSSIDDALPVYTQCGYQFTTNEEPALNLEYLDEPDRSFEFPDVAQEWELYDRDYAVVFRETENRGDVFTIDLWLYMGGTPASNNVPDALRGRPAFQALIDLVRAQLSYVCVLDQDGTRWFAALLMDKSKAVRKDPGEKYLFPIRVRQVTATPSTPDVTP